jgi:hypothetical protein
MADKHERRFLLLAGLLVLASWAAVGWCAATGKPRLYHNEFDPARVVRRLPDGRYLVRLPAGETAEVEIPDHVVRHLTSQSTVMVMRRAYLGGFKTKWRCAPY